MKATAKKRKPNHPGPARAAQIKNVAPPQSQWKVWLPPLLIVALAFIAYSDSFHGPFILDDLPSLHDNSEFNPGYPLSINPQTTLSGRPVLKWTFFFNNWIGGFKVTNYHVTNLAIHIAAALLLYGIVRRNLMRRQAWGETFSRSGPWVAATVAAVWAVHPLTTQAVTYIIQRAESLASLLYLLVIYGLIRSDDSPRWKIAWQILAVAACAIGLYVKEILGTAPLIALLYDRAFLTGSFKAAIQQRKWFYLSLALTWGLLAEIIREGARSTSVGFSAGMSSWVYFRTQLNVVAHYVFLAVRPLHLCFDYAGWPLAYQWRNITLGGYFIIAMAAITVVLLVVKPKLGFLGAWFFFILAPTSSFLPIPSEIGAEHRMYLPLVPFVVLFVVGGWLLVHHWGTGRVAAYIAAVFSLGGLSILTIHRNADYSTAERIWKDVLAAEPNNKRAMLQVGKALMEDNRVAEAIPYFERVLEANPNSPAAAEQLGRAYLQMDGPAKAEDFYTREMSALPIFAPEAHTERGIIRIRQHDFAGAADDFKQVTQSQPANQQAHYLLALCFEQLGRLQEAEFEYYQTARIDPNYADTQARLAKLMRITEP